jgi:hypothetical protein
MNEYEKVVSLEKIRLALLRRHEKEQVEAFKPLLKNYREPVKIVSSITEEMIKEYENENKNKPIEVDGKLYKHHPVDSEFELIEYKPLHEPHEILDDVEIEDVKRDMNTIVEENDRVEQKFKRELDYLNSKITSLNTNIERIYNSLDVNEKRLSEMDDKTRKEFVNSSAYISWMTKTNNKLRESEVSLDKVNIEKAKYTSINEVEKNRIITENNNKYRIKEGLINTNLERIREEDDEKERISKINEGRKQERIKTLEMLNSGRFDMRRDPRETDEQYIKRIDDITKIEVSEDLIEKEAEIENMQKFKSNLKDIVRLDSKIENIVKSFDKDDIFLINSRWVKVKKIFLDNYGFNNKNLNSENMIATLVTILDDIKKKPFYEDKDDVDVSLPIDSKIDYPKTVGDIEINEDDDTGALHLKNNTTLADIYLLIAQKKDSVGVILPYLSYSFNKSIGGIGKYSIIRFNSTEDVSKLSSHLDITVEELTEILGGFNKKKISKTDMSRIMLKHPILKKFSGTAKKKGKKWGYGVSINKLPDICPFGNIFINIDKLYHKNTLSVFNSNKLKILGFPNVTVSEGFVSLIMKMCNNENIKPKDITNLQINEKELYDHLLHVAKLNKEIKSGSGNETVEKLKHRLQLIEGQIESGNNNPEILKELYDVLTKMVNFNLISQSEFKRYYKQMQKKINV